MIDIYKPNMWPYKRIFEKYKADCEIFIETGTHYGGSLQDALDLGFKKLFSVELDIDLYKYCIKRFQNHLNKTIFLHWGDSAEILPQILTYIDKRAMFWLDAHGNSEGPFRQELELIMKHPINNHVIVIDDIGSYGCDEGWIKDTLLKFNPEYRFENDNCAAKQLICYI